MRAVSRGRGRHHLAPHPRFPRTGVSLNSPGFLLLPQDLGGSPGVALHALPGEREPFHRGALGSGARGRRAGGSGPWSPSPAFFTVTGRSLGTRLHQNHYRPGLGNRPELRFLTRSKRGRFGRIGLAMLSEPSAGSELGRGRELFKTKVFHTIKAFPPPTDTSPLNQEPLSESIKPVTLMKNLQICYLIASKTGCYVFD